MEEIRKHLYNLLQSGIPLPAAFTLVGATEEQIKLLEADKEFMGKVGFYEAYQEKTLLERLNRVMEINESKGISTEIRWLLTKKFPQRYGSRQIIVNESGDLPTPVVRQFVPSEDDFDDTGEDD